MPTSIPQPRLMILITGVCEIAGGIGILIPRVRWWAGWGLLVLLVGVFPVNVHMLTSEWRQAGFTFYALLLLLRLPLQGLFMAWVYRAQRE